MTAGDLVTAHGYYAAALIIATRIADGDPANPLWQRDLAANHAKLGDLAVAGGDLPAARAAYQTATDIATRLAKADPANSTWQELARHVQGQLAGVLSSS